MSSANTSVTIPYSFAELHGVMLEGDTVYCYQDLGIPVLLELQRALGIAFQLEKIDQTVFKKRLTKHYQTTDGAAQRAADDLDAEMDLSQLANDLQEQTDLLAGNDDAPVIRLINAILSEAVKEATTLMSDTQLQSNPTGG